VAANPYVFIVGCPRSGTTLLQRIVGAHPAIAVVFETHWIPRWFEERRGLTPEGLVTPRLADELLKDRRFKNFDVDHEELGRLVTSDEPLPYSRFVTALFDLHGRAPKAKAW
jgi:Sulfotransferase family